MPPVRPRQTLAEKYIERFVRYAGTGCLDLLKEIAEEIGPERMAVMVKLGVNQDLNPAPEDKIKNRETALFAAAFGGHSDVVNFLLSYGADVHSKNGKTGATPLLAAVSSRNEECIKTLFRHGGDPDALTSSGSITPRTLAEKRGLSHLFT